MKLQKLRKNKNLLQKDIANYLNVALSTYCYWEQGKTEMDFDNLLKLSNYFSVSIDYLLCQDINYASIASIDPDYASMLTLWNQMSPDQKSVTLKYMELVSETTSKSNAPFSRKKSNYQQNKLDDNETITLPVVARSGERTQITTTRKQFDEDIRNLKPSDDEDL